MYGIPASLDLSDYLGHALIQVCLGEFQLQLHFESESRSSLEIGVEGGWELRDGNGDLVDAGTPTLRPTCQLQLLLGSPVVSVSIDAPRSLALTFDTGHELRIFDDSDEHETITLQPLGVIV